MNLLPQTNALRKTILLYRFLRYRKGFGVHSPFAFSFITKVIDERYGYYAYNDIELIRRQLVHRNCPMLKTDIKRSHGELLFRIVNYFKPERLIQIGTSAGIGSLYMTAPSSRLNYLLLDSDDNNAEQTIWSLRKFNPKASSVSVIAGDYLKTLPAALSKMSAVDFLFFNSAKDKEKNMIYLDEAIKYVQSDTVFFIEGIRSNREMRQLWKNICLREDVSVTFDLYNVGVVFFNKKLHKQNYIVFF